VVAAFIHLTSIAWLTTFNSLEESRENKLGPLPRKAGRINLALSGGKLGDKTWP
jgi:hypothetical protein